MVWLLHLCALWGLAIFSDLCDELCRFVRTANFTDNDEDYERLCQMIDIQSYIDYMCAEIYISNVDWPGNNYEMWRSASVTDRPYEDGRWRWMLYDTEFSSGSDSRTKADSDAFARAHSDIMFQYVIKNATFPNLIPAITPMTGPTPAMFSS